MELSVKPWREQWGESAVRLTSVEEVVAWNRRLRSTAALHCAGDGSVPCGLLSVEKPASEFGTRIVEAGKADHIFLGWECPERSEPTPSAAEPYRELSSEHLAFYRALTACPLPTITVWCAVSAADTTEDRGLELLARLVEVGLLEKVGENRYRMPCTGWTRARGLPHMAGRHGCEAPAVVRRVALAHLRFAADLDFRVLPLRWRLGPAFFGLTLPEGREPTDGKQALAQLRDERENLAAVIRAAYRYGFYDLVWQLCEAMWGLHLRLGFHAQWSDTHLLGVEAARTCARESGDPRAVGRMLVQLAFGYMGIGNFGEAESALDAAVIAERGCGHRRGEASALEALGLLCLRRERPEPAQQFFEEARNIWQRVNDGEDGRQDKERAMTLLAHHIGRALRDAGKPLAARDSLTDAQTGFRKLGDPYNEGRVCMSLGEMYLQIGDWGRAQGCVEGAVDAMRVAGAGLQLAGALELRACYHYRAGRLGETGADLRAAASGYEEHADPKALARVGGMLAEWGV